MSSKDDKASGDGIPAWQRNDDGDAPAQSDQSDDTRADPQQAIETTALEAQQDARPAQTPDEAEERLATARRFLQDDQVKTASEEEKLSFLRTKGVSDEEAQKLLSAPSSTSSSYSSSSPAPASYSPNSPQRLDISDRPPVITYPEFLAKPARPPPLVTQSILLNTLSATAALSTLLYASSTYVVAPMVDALTAARSDLYAHASTHLGKLTTTLESCVSEVPPAANHSTRQLVSEDDASDSDPTELFHRDVGTQTTPIEPRTPAFPRGEETSIAKQEKRLKDLTASVRDVTKGFEKESDALQALNSSLEETQWATQELLPSFTSAHHVKHGERNDEIRKARENTRRLKGTLLSTRSYGFGRWSTSGTEQA